MSTAEHIVNSTDYKVADINLAEWGRRELDIAEGTVKVHVKHLFKKLDLRSRVEAAVWATKHGLG